MCTCSIQCTSAGAICFCCARVPAREWLCVCVVRCRAGAVPRNELAGQLGAMRMVCYISEGDIFNDFQTEPWAALRPTETSSSRWKPPSPRAPVIFTLTYTLATQDLTVYDLWIQTLLFPANARANLICRGFLRSLIHAYSLRETVLQ